MRCLDENAVIELFEGVLPDEAHAAIERHVDGCGGCRRLLAELARVDDEEPTLTEEQGILHPGQLLAGRFLVRRLLGAGSMGNVYAATDQQLDEEVAIKVLSPELSAADHLHHLYHEVGVSRRISHPNVCRVHDIGTSGSIHFITMAFVEGESLDRIIARGRARHGFAISVLAQICDALDAAHRQGIVHRDLKPSNIMVEPGGRVIVMDFGLARDLRGEISSRTGVLIGTPAYWSPEQARGDRATERSDVFALGMIACDLFGAPRPSFGEAPDRLPAPIARVVARLLRVDPRERPFPAEVRQLLAQATRPRIASVRTSIALGVLGLVGASSLALAMETFEPQRFDAPVQVKAAPIVAQENGERTAAIRRLGSIEEQRRARALLVSDVRDYAVVMLDARRALERDDLDAARAAMDLLEARIGSTIVGADFVSRKMRRMRKLTRSIDDPGRDQVEKIFARVRDRFSEGDYAAANAHLNALLPLIEEQP